jgi:hypothetical protein
MKRLSDFDCELPRAVIGELRRPKRARILVPPEPPQKPPGDNSGRSVAGRWLWVLFLVLTLVVLAGRFATTPASHPVTTQPAVQSSPAATPAAVVTARRSLATLQGDLDSEAQLPRVGHIGNLYVGGDVPWVFIQVPGTAAPTWVDP